MKIAIISDLHLGYKKNTEIERDAFEAFEEALKKSKDADMILIAGDIFDTRNPDTETFIKCMELLLPFRLKNTHVKLIKGINKDIDSLSEIHAHGTPIVAIHGTHERRSRNLLNPVQALEKAGFLIHLNCNGVVFEKDGERIAIQGLSAVPDQYAVAVIDEWNPKPVKDCFNIFMCHQSIEGYVYAQHTFPLEKLPKGFDIYIAGHIHNPQISTYENKPLIITGSSIETQIKSGEIGKKVFWMLNTKNNEIKEIEYESQRPVYILENLSQEQIEKEIEGIIEKQHKKRPIVKIITDKISPELRTKFEEKVILILQERGSSENLQRVALEEHRESVQEMGRRILEENLKNMGLDVKIFESVFELSLEKKDKDIVELLKEVCKHKKPRISENKKGFETKHWKDILKSG